MCRSGRRLDAALPTFRQPARQDLLERANVGRSRRVIAVSGAHLARARAVRPDRDRHVNHVVDRDPCQAAAAASRPGSPSEWSTAARNASTAA